jgi:hypothetical protein
VSYVELPIVRAWLRVIGTADDVLIQRLIDQAEDEAMRFLNRTMPPTLPLEYPSECQSSEEIPSSDDPIAPSFEKAVCILVQAAYEQPDPDKAAKMRDNAFALLWPYRAMIGA